MDHAVMLGSEDQWFLYLVYSPSSKDGSCIHGSDQMCSIQQDRTDTLYKTSDNYLPEQEETNEDNQRSRERLLAQSAYQ